MYTVKLSSSSCFCNVRVNSRAIRRTCSDKRPLQLMRLLTMMVFVSQIMKIRLRVAVGQLSPFPFAHVSSITKRFRKNRFKGEAL